MSTISASTTSTTAYKVTADTTGTLVIQTGATPTTAVTVGTDQSVTFAGTLTTSSRGIAKASMPTGSVLQVVSATYSTQVSTTSATFVSTPLTASITPTSSTSKILVIVAGTGGSTTTSGNAFYTIAKGTTNLLNSNGGSYLYNGGGANYGVVSMQYLDSPATTSATSYTVYFRADSPATVYFCLGNATNVITLMEIAA
jgi:hypothetical protein